MRSMADDLLQVIKSGKRKGIMLPSTTIYVGGFQTFPVMHVEVS